MDYRTLGKSELNVSQLCLGTMTFGEQNSEQEAHQQLDYAVDNGINFLDTAEMYPVPPKAETQGLTETYIGHWLQQRGNREKLIIASKVTGAAEWMKHIRGGPRFTAGHINEAINGSLKRLQTDYIDLYQLHWPDRNTNFFGVRDYQHQSNYDETPLKETLFALKALVDAGKVRYIGLSNETPWGVMSALSLAKEFNLPTVASIQNPYSLLNRTFEVGLAEVSHREDVPLLAYSPLAFGVLTGKYLNNQWPENARITLFKRFSRYLNETGTRATQDYVNLAKELGLTPTELALAFVNSRSFLGSNIIGATSLSQLKENINSIKVELSEDVLDQIENVHQNNPNPCP